MKSKPITPYIRLLSEAKKWAFSAKHRHTVSMFWYARAKLGDGWSLTDLYERTKAADQLGFDVRVVAKDDGLHVQYVKRCPEIPYGWQ
jgi:hypothetical protein